MRRRTKYVYDTLNRLTTLTYPSRTNFTFSNDALGRRTQMTRPNGVATNYTLTVPGKLVSGALNVVQRGKLLYDAGTYVGALIVCAEE